MGEIHFTMFSSVSLGAPINGMTPASQSSIMFFDRSRESALHSTGFGDGHPFQDHPPVNRRTLLGLHQPGPTSDQVYQWSRIFVGNAASQASGIVAEAGNNVQNMRAACLVAAVPQDTVGTLKCRIARYLRLNYPTIDEPRPRGATLRLSYTLQQRQNASKLFDQSSISFGGVLAPEMDHISLEELGLRNSDECSSSLTCDDWGF